MGFHDEDDFEDMSEQQRIELEDDVLESAIINSYLMLTGKLKFSDLMQQSTGDIIAVTTFDPDEGPTLEQLEIIIEYFEEDEQYEKCAEIKKILDEMYPKK